MDTLDRRMRTRAARAATLLWDLPHQQAVATIDGTATPAAVDPALRRRLITAYTTRANDPHVVSALIDRTFAGHHQLVWADRQQLAGHLTDLGRARHAPHTTTETVTATFRLCPTSWALLATSADDGYTAPTPDVDWADADILLRDCLSAAHHWTALLSDLDRAVHELAACG